LFFFVSTRSLRVTLVEEEEAILNVIREAIHL
jgi:hypothetical protein